MKKMGTNNLVKEKVVKFKLKHFCWITSVRYGVFALGYFNLFVSVVCLVSTANDSFFPTLKKLQEMILDIETNHKTACTLAYTAEEAINVILILGLHRRDLVLLGIYMFLGAGAAVLTLFIYMIVFLRIDLVTSTLMLLEIAYQCYFLLLVRSEIVDMKEQRHKSELQKEKEINEGSELKDETATDKDVEASLESVCLEKRKLDTVIESSDEDSSEKD